MDIPHLPPICPLERCPAGTETETKEMLPHHSTKSTPKAKKAWNPSSITCAARNQGKKVATLRTSTYFYAGRPALGGLLHEQPTTSSPPSQHKNTFERQSRSHTAAAASPSASRISLNLVSCLQLFRFRRVMCRSGGMVSIPRRMQGNAQPFA